MKGAIEKAHELVASTPGAWMPMQFDNPSNPEIHISTTAQEILHDFPEGFDYLITGVGTGGHISGGQPGPGYSPSVMIPAKGIFL